jgi:hypothetical protein
MYVETLAHPALAYLPGQKLALPYLLDHPELVDLAPEVTQLYELARGFIFFEDQSNASVLVVLDVTPLCKGAGIPLLMQDTAEAFASKRLTFNLSRAALADKSLSDSRNAHSTDHREWLKWVSAFYDAIPTLDAEADIDLYLIASDAYRDAPTQLTTRAYSHLRWHVDAQGCTYVVPVN